MSCSSRADVGARGTGALVVGVEVLDAEVDADARGAEVVGGVLEVLGAGPDHHDVVAEAQLGVGDRAVGVVVAGEGLEAERALEEVDRGGGVAVAGGWDECSWERG